jgi:hypothetical protein
MDADVRAGAMKTTMQQRLRETVRDVMVGVAAASAGLLPAIGHSQAQSAPMEVLSVFAPGNGSNQVSATARPKSYDSQLRMYRDLPLRLEGLDEAGLRTYFRPETFEIPSGAESTTITPRPGLRIVRDAAYNIPHVHGDTRELAMFGVGYARAQDRLWQMEVFRATCRAASAELFGPGADNENFQADARTFRLVDYSEQEYAAMFASLETQYGSWGKQASQDLVAYVDGLNAYLDQIEAHPELLPMEYRKRQLKPRRWSTSDVVAMAAYSHVAWGGLMDARADANSRLFDQLKQKFGDGAQSVYDDLRMAPNANTPISISGGERWQTPENPKSRAILDLGSFVAREIVQVGKGRAFAAFVNPAAARVRSNALLVAASKSKTGRPISVQGPQDGYGTPHLFDSQIKIAAPDFKASGVLEVSGPYPYVASRGDNYAWSITVLSPSQSDLYAEKLCEPNGKAATIQSDYYLYQGKCIALTERSDVRGASKGPRYTLTSLRSVHGPILGRATVQGVPVAIAQGRTSYLHEEMDFPAHAQLFSPSAVRSAQDFINIVSGTAYNVGWWYIDQKDIAVVDAGRVPVRHHGASTDFPVWGTGEWDWLDFDPKAYTFRSPPADAYPHSINSPDGVLAGWNNASSMGWPVASHVWGWGTNHVSLLKDPTVAAVENGPIDITDLVKIHTQAAITDYRAWRYYPVMRQFLGTATDPHVEALLLAADAWIKDGSFRRDQKGVGYLDHGQAIAFLDHVWQPVIKTVFEPVLGAEVLKDAGGLNNLGSLRTGPAHSNGWLDYLMMDMPSSAAPSPARGPGRRRAQQVKLSRRYCGSDDVSCRALLNTALTQALHDASARYGADPARWRVPVICNDCVQLNFPATGDAQPVPPISWQNRGTYLEVVTGR